MQDPTKPKVLYPLADKPLVGHVLEIAKAVGSSRTIAIIGFGREQVREYISDIAPSAEFAVQDQQLGTGHALQQIIPLLSDFDGNLLILYGDVPLLTKQSVRKLLDHHISQHARATILTALFEDPTGYGRIVRTSDGKHLSAIVEERDASEEIKLIKEMNSGIYVFDAKTLLEFLDKLTTNNNQKEYYLTDVFSMINLAYGENSVALSICQNPIEVSGVNTKDQLSELERYYLQQK